MARALALGRALPLDGAGAPTRLDLSAHHLTTHAVVVGMTGSGKTGLVMVLVEEALRRRPFLLVPRGTRAAEAPSGASRRRSAQRLPRRCARDDPATDPRPGHARADAADATASLRR